MREGSVRTKKRILDIYGEAFFIFGRRGFRIPEHGLYSRGK
jgi:hypothetical protein